MISNQTMFVRLEKIDLAKNQRRFYTVTILCDLFGEWVLAREWGRIGSRGGQRRSEWFASPEEAEAVLAKIKRQKEGSICVANQGRIGSHFRFSETSVFATMASFRMTAVIATLKGFPFSRRRW